ncbi:MAG: hypothetical protein K2V71_03505 [Methylotenera sp.]|nr:hypothetical protein [Methylotenera sp.]
MTNHRLFKYLIVLSCSFYSHILLAQEARPDLNAANVAIHIAKTHYHHPVRLMHYFRDVWHLKGPMAEKASLNALKKHFADAQVCDNGKDANIVLQLEPRMFYNAQFRVFYSEITAKVFINSTPLPDVNTPILTIKQQAQQSGDLMIQPDFAMEKAYTKAVGKVIEKLQTDQTLLNALHQAKQNATNNNDSKALCAALDDLPVPKIYF